jgi:hypothetical protein
LNASGAFATGPARIAGSNYRSAENADRVIIVIADILVAIAVKMGRDRVRIDLSLPKRSGCGGEIIRVKRVHPIVHGGHVHDFPHLARHMDSGNIERLGIDSAYHVSRSAQPEIIHVHIRRVQLALFEIGA